MKTRGVAVTTRAKLWSYGKVKSFDMKTLKESSRVAKSTLAFCVLVALASSAPPLRADDSGAAPSPQTNATAAANEAPPQRRVQRRYNTPATIPNSSKATRNAAPMNYDRDLRAKRPTPSPSVPIREKSESGESPSVWSKLFSNSLFSRDEEKIERAPERAPRSTSKREVEAERRTKAAIPQPTVERSTRNSVEEERPTVAIETRSNESATLDSAPASRINVALDATELDAQPQAPIEEFDEAELENMLRSFAALNASNEAAARNARALERSETQNPTLGSDQSLTTDLDLDLETSVETSVDVREDAEAKTEAENLLAPTLALDDETSAPVPTLESARNAADDREDVAAFADELDEIDALEASAANAPVDFGYFKKSRPTSRALESPLASSESTNASDVESEFALDLGADEEPIVEVDKPSTEGEEVASNAFEIDFGAAERVENVADRRELGISRPATNGQGYLSGRSTSAFRGISTPSRASVFNSSAYGGDGVKTSVRVEDSVDLGDVAEFAGERIAQTDDDVMESTIVDSSDFPEDELTLESVDLETLKDECYWALDHYSSLFIEYEPTAEWTERVLENVDGALDALENAPQQARERIKALKTELSTVDAVKERVVQASRIERATRNPWRENDDAEPTIASRYALAQRLELLDAFVKSLERRAFLWTRAADYFDAKRRGALTLPTDFTTAELALVVKSSEDARAFFGDAPNGRNWRASFDVDEVAAEARRALEIPESRTATAVARASALSSDDESVGYLGVPVASTPADPYLDAAVAADARAALANDPVARERSRRMRFLRDRVNAAAYKIEKTPMTPEQRRVFEKPALARWSNLMTTFSSDQANGLALLFAFERYERLGGGAANAALQQLALRMTTSKSEECRKFGRAIDAIYDNPNMKAYISEALINRLLPVRDPEFSVVQERILDNPVVGSRRVDAQVSIRLVPNAERLLMNLNVTGRAVANTSSSVMSAKLHNQSYVNYFATKTIEWRDAGVAYSPASVSAAATNRLNAVETDVDFVPLIGDVAREITRSQYEARQYEIQEETRVKTIRETSARFDREANERFDALNARLRTAFFRKLTDLGLSMRLQRSRTTDDWLLASLRLGAAESLGCQTTEPATLPGAFADLKIHESAVNSFLHQLDFSGRSTTPRQALDLVAEKLDLPQLREVRVEESDVVFSFAKFDPVVARFYEDQVQIILRFDRIALGTRTWDDVEVVASYRPTAAEDGAPTFIRDGVVEICGPASAREQLPLRAVFSKVFPARKSFELRPEIMRKDERFAGLTIGLCRASRGWLAMSIVRDPEFQRQKELTATPL